MDDGWVWLQITSLLRIKVSLAERLCNVCREECVEDEMHFLIYCESLLTERQAFSSNIAKLYQLYMFLLYGMSMQS